MFHPATTAIHVVQWTVIPFPQKKLKEYLHTTNSQTEEEVGGSETKQLDAKIQSVKITACKDTHMFVMKNISLRV